MSVELTREDFRTLVGIVAQAPGFQSVTGRIRLVSGALAGSPRANDILSLLDLDGSPRGVAVEVIRSLAAFGRVTSDKEALGIFLNELLFLKGDEDEDAAFIRGLFETYSLDKPIIQSSPIDEWHGTEDSAYVQEKIIGEDTLRHIRVLDLALKAAQAVVHVRLPFGVGTGFMVGPSLLMTNNHIIRTAEQAARGEFTFNYQLDSEGNLEKTTTATAKKGGLFHTRASLDYTVVELDGVPPSAHPLLLRAVQVNRDERVAIIQHAGGHLKKISMQNNFVAYADPRLVQYTTSTMPGSSGSPVFNDDFHVIAIHHGGGLLREPDTNRRYLRNAGTSMIAILKDLRQSESATEIYARLNR
jgi:V8-like Glu-specific endopeptidase